MYGPVQVSWNLLHVLEFVLGDTLNLLATARPGAVGQPAELHPGTASRDHDSN